MITKRDTNWQYTGDVNTYEYGGKWFRRTTGRQYQFIEVTNMNEACGRDNEGRPTYVVELALVDLDAIPQRSQVSAVRSCGGPDDGTTPTGEWLAVACYEFGCRAPLESWEGNNAGKMLREARSLAHKLKADSEAMADRMERPVNRIGSTADEYMRGDTHSAVLRGVAEGRTDAEIMLKMGC